MSAPHETSVPAPILAGAAALIAFAFTASWLSIQTGVGVTRLSDASIVQARDLLFKDGPNGSVVVVDVQTGGIVETIESGQGGFERGVLRSLARERRTHALEKETPFKLVRRADGSLSIEDPSTGRRVELDAFGTTNVKSFSRLVDTPPQSGVRNSTIEKGDGA